MMQMQNASLIKRFAACLYESLSLIAIWLLCTMVFVTIWGVADTDLKRYSLQGILWLVSGFYLVVCWVRTGQTLASQAWKIKLVDQHGRQLNWRTASLRYVLVCLSLVMFGLGFLWAIVDKEQLFLHDRLLKTRLIK